MEWYIEIILVLTAVNTWNIIALSKQIDKLRGLIHDELISPAENNLDGIK